MSKFQLGNPGKPKGVTNRRSQEWLALRDAIVGYHSPQFNRLLADLWEDPDLDNRIKGAMLYLQALNYFQPKLSNVDHSVYTDDKIEQIVIEIIDPKNADPNQGDTSISPNSVE